jgi:predicted outer membrane repeat protein
LIPRHFVRVATLAAALASAANGGDLYLVDRFDDSLADACTEAESDCGLRGAIIAANAAGIGTVVLGDGTYELTRTTGTEEESRDLDITSHVYISGLSGKTVIDANGIDRVFDVNVTTDGEGVRFERLKITGGDPNVTIIDTEANSGGGIRISSGYVQLFRCELSDNHAPLGHGGAIYNGGPHQLDVTTTLISDNSAEDGGAILSKDLNMLGSSVIGNATADGGAVKLTEVASIRISTIGHNTASEGCVDLVSECGGVVLAETGIFARIENSTIVGNDIHQVVVLSHEKTPPLTMNNTLIGGDCFLPQEGLISEGGNIESPNDTCMFGESDLVSVADLGLETPAANHGGPTPTYLPLDGSPAIDLSTADDFCLVDDGDQRGAFRNQDGDGDATPHCDSGAVEIQGPGEFFFGDFEDGEWTGWSVAVPGS